MKLYINSNTTNHRKPNNILLSSQGMEVFFNSLNVTYTQRVSLQQCDSPTALLEKKVAYIWTYSNEFAFKLSK